MSTNMVTDDGNQTNRRRWLRLIGRTSALVVIGEILWAASAALWLVPAPILKMWELGIPPLLLFFCYRVLSRRPTRISSISIPSALWQRLDDGARWLFKGRLSIVFSLLCLALLATWIPHYLEWPWWSDTDHFAVTALSWERGILPYRDLLDFNFPGPVYLFWTLGKVFGWGRTSPIYVVDVLLLLLFGAVLLFWSRRRFGHLLPGLVGVLVCLTYYLNLPYSQVAQRDWQGPLIAVLGILLLELRPGRAARVGSALIFAVALSYRPHMILLLPAAFSAVDESVRAPGEPFRRTFWALFEWLSVVGLGTFLTFCPLLFSGIAGDLVQSFRQSAWYGDSNLPRNHPSALGYLINDLFKRETFYGLVLLMLMAVLSKDSSRGLARTWVLALGFVLLYKPISPVVFDYHNHPLVIVSSVGLCVLVAELLSSPHLTPSFQALTLATILGIYLYGLPSNCSAYRSAIAIRGAVLGTPPTLAPLGSEQPMPNRGKRRRAKIYWDDYSIVLNYVRMTTTPRTRVANFIRAHPCPPVNGPVGRLTAFPCAEGIQWLRWVSPELEEYFAQCLLRNQDTVVVWDPGATGFRAMERTIREHFQYEAGFGSLEIWRRSEQAASEAHRDGIPAHSEQVASRIEPRPGAARERVKAPRSPEYHKPETDDEFSQDVADANPHSDTPSSISVTEPSDQLRATQSEKGR